MLPVAAALGTLLLMLGQRRNALTWWLVIAATFGAVVVLKMTFAPCLPPSPLAVLRSPSGHTASAVVVFGGVMALLGGRVLATLAPALAVGGLIGASRVLLGMHSLPEVVVGGSVGLSGAGVLAACWRPVSDPAMRRRLAWIALATVVGLAVALHGLRWSAEGAIHTLSYRFWPLHACRG